MKIINRIDKMKTHSRILKKSGKLIGLVPTMGYLHEGHLSLLRTAKKQCDTLILSIFINPIQFGPEEDFEKYPRDMQKDEEKAKLCGVDIIFNPPAEEMYPEGFSTYVNVENLTDNLCGLSRPGHFKGVTTVVAKLFEIVKPDLAFFGQKDAQQAFIVRRMVEDLNMDVTLRLLPTVREKSGLAMSSRNFYLTEQQKKEASVLYRALESGKEFIESGERNPKKVIKKIKDIIGNIPSAKIDYVSIVDTAFMKDISQIEGEILIAAAVNIGKARLIDNIILKVADSDTE